jgi:glycosyltransferase involved in cell wall biosynthesis
MAAAVPIIATDNNGYRSVMDNGRQGILVADASPERFAASLMELLRDDKLRSRLGTTGRKTAEELYSWKLVADEVERYYMNLIDPAAEAAAVLELESAALLPEQQVEAVPTLHD